MRHPFVLDAAHAEDACSDVTLTWSLDSVPEASATGGLLVTWTATDACGNTADAAQTVTLVDNTPPTWLHVPADASLALGEDLPWATWLAEVQVEDLCTDGPDLSVNFTWDTLANEGACTDTLEVIWTVTDAGASSSAVQLVALSDVQAPVVPNWPEDGNGSTCPQTASLANDANDHT